jgi:hypothetical protein
VLDDIPVLQNRTVPLSSASEIGQNRIPDGFVNLVNPSTGEGYYVPQTVVRRNWICQKTLGFVLSLFPFEFLCYLLLGQFQFFYSNR